jgi:hydrogenase maturation protease
MNTAAIGIVGIGNTLRSDDGVGAYIVQAIDDKHLPEVNCMVMQQLQTELMEDLTQYKMVIIVDAAVKGMSWIFEKLETVEIQSPSISHHIDAKTFATLAKQLYNSETQFYYCGIRGENFGIGEKISPTVLQYANEAVEEIFRFVLTGGH